MQFAPSTRARTRERGTGARKFTARSGKLADSEPKIGLDCAKKKKSGRKHRRP